MSDKLKIGDRMVIAANDQTTIVLRRYKAESDPAGKSRYALEIYDANISAFERRIPVDKNKKLLLPVSTVRFASESRARILARAIGFR